MSKKIYAWGLVPSSPYHAPEVVTMHIHGLLDSEDSEHWIKTSRIVGKRNGLIVTNSGSEYELMDVNEQYERQFPNARERVFNNLEEV